MYEMKKNNPEKEFIATMGKDGCSCSDCTYMKMNTLEKLYKCIRDEKPEIVMSDELIKKAEKPILRMLDMSNRAAYAEALKALVQGELPAKKISKILFERISQ